MSRDGSVLSPGEGTSGGGTYRSPRDGLGIPILGVPRCSVGTRARTCTAGRYSSLIGTLGIPPSGGVASGDTGAQHSGMDTAGLVHSSAARVLVGVALHSCRE